MVPLIPLQICRSELSIEQLADTPGERERESRPDIRVGDVLHLQLDSLETPFGYPLVNTEPAKNTLDLVMRELEQALKTGATVQGRPLNPTKGGMAVGVAGFVCYCPNMYCSPDTPPAIGVLCDFKVIAVQPSPPPRAHLRDVKSIHGRTFNAKVAAWLEQKQQFSDAKLRGSPTEQDPLAAATAF